MARYRVSADIGGTFTDLVISEVETGKTFTGKLPSTPANPSAAVLKGIEESIPDPQAIDFMVHGTTVALNAFLERKGARVLLITTAGLRDSYVIARGDRPELYKLKYRKPQRLVPRHDVHEVRERLLWDGTVHTPLHAEDFEPIIQKVRQENIPAVAVCFIHAFAYPRHELEARDILARALPGVSITLSHEVAREWREYERASTAIMNAYIAPPVEKYLTCLQDEMHQLGVRSTLYVMQSSGGILTVDTAIKHPVQTLLSGPVGGVIGGTALAEATGRPNLICVDMGGTSFDMSLIRGGRPTVTSQTYLEGLPLLMAIQEIHTIGAGGGSIARVEAGGLRVGPQSAGADPGPACYGKGGAEPTVTDANLLLKRIGPSSLLGGRITLYEEPAREAVRKVASQLDMEDLKLAEGILAVINGRMADGIRTITVSRGIDPRDYTLVAFGGAGPMHAVWLAEELDIREIIVPNSPGAFSALGMLQADLRHDLMRSFYHAFDAVTMGDVWNVYHELVTEGTEALSAEGIQPDRMYFELTSDMRYIGQEYSVNVPITPAMTPEQIGGAFHAAYHDRYGHSTPAAPIEFVNLRLAALGRINRQPMVFEPVEAGQNPIIDRRQVVFGGRALDTPVYQRMRLEHNTQWKGPMIVEEDTATTVIPPGYQACVDGLGNIIITAEQRT